MMKTSRIALWILCLALVASCTKNGNEGDDVPENGFRAKIEQTKGGGSKGERTHINPEWDPNGYSETPLYWSEGDLIKVSNRSGTTLTFQLAEGENTMYGTFYTGEQNDGFFVPDYMAAYPAANAEGTATTISGGTATFSMLSTQSYKANTFDEGAMPMVASSSTQTLNFRNVFGGLCVPIIVQGRGLQVTSVKLTSLNTNDKLWGVFSADCTSTNPLPTYVSGGDNILTLDCGTGVALDATVPTDFYFMVPPGTLESGFTVTAYNGTTVLYEETADWTASPPATPFIRRRVIMKVNTNLEVVVDPLVVRTVSPTFITTNSAYGLGQVTSDPDNVFDRFGFLYMKYDDLTNPSNVATELVVNGTNVLEPATLTVGSVCYGADLSSLDLDTRYYVRAYAVDAIGRISYGDPILFATRRDYYAPGPYQGVMKNAAGTPYEFSVAPDKKVYFSMGNLQYQASTNTWRFAEYQYEYVANGHSSDGNYRGLVFTGGMYPSGEVGTKCDNELISSSYNGWIDLFGWGTSGQNHGAVCYQPWSTSENYSDYYAYGNSANNLFDQTGQADWGCNAISNGGNTANSGWRTLEGNNVHHQADGLLEWGYLLGPLVNSHGGGLPYVYNYRSGKRFAYVVMLVRGTADKSISGAAYTYPACGRSNGCLIVFPDSFGTTWPEGVRSLTCDSPTAFQYLTEAEWSLLEREGCVIMPCCGSREGNIVYNISGLDNGPYDVPMGGLYWSANSINNSSPGATSFLYFTNKEINPVSSEVSYMGLAVRLVRDAN